MSSQKYRLIKRRIQEKDNKWNDGKWATLYAPGNFMAGCKNVQRVFILMLLSPHGEGGWNKF
jgi:hypothetical protein